MGDRVWVSMSRGEVELLRAVLEYAAWSKGGPEPAAGAFYAASVKELQAIELVGLWPYPPDYIPPPMRAMFSVN